MAMAKGEAVEVVFEAGDPGEFAYFCTVSGHRQAGMEGKLIITEP
jgi:nitrite reductase (NO-forming)